MTSERQGRAAREQAAREEQAAQDEQNAADEAERSTEADAERQNVAAREAQAGARGGADEEDEESDESKQAREQNEAARHAQESARETAVYGGFGGEVPQLPRGVKRPEVGDKVYYALDHDGIPEWLEAEVTDREPWQDGFRIPNSMSEAELNLAVKVDMRRHYAARPVVLRTNVPYGDGPGNWLPDKPRNADDTFRNAMARRSTREAMRREEMAAAAGQQATAPLP